MPNFYSRSVVRSFWQRDDYAQKLRKFEEQGERFPNQAMRRALIIATMLGRIAVSIIVSRVL